MPVFSSYRPTPASPFPASLPHAPSRTSSLPFRAWCSPPPSPTPTRSSCSVAPTAPPPSRRTFHPTDDAGADSPLLHSRPPPVLGVDTSRWKSDEPPLLYIFINSSTRDLASIEKYVEKFATSVLALQFNLELDTLCSDLGLLGFPQKICTTGSFLNSSQYIISDNVTTPRQS